MYDTVRQRAIARVHAYKRSTLKRYPTHQIRGMTTSINAALPNSVYINTSILIVNLRYIRCKVCMISYTGQVYYIIKKKV